MVVGSVSLAYVSSMVDDVLTVFLQEMAIVATMEFPSLLILNIILLLLQVQMFMTLLIPSCLG